MTQPFGTPELFLELITLLDHDPLRKAVAEYGRFLLAEEDEEPRISSKLSAVLTEDMRIFSARLGAHAAAHERDPKLAAKVWSNLSRNELYFVQTQNASGDAITELLRRERVMMSTNIASQWSINVIQCLSILGEH